MPFLLPSLEIHRNTVSKSRYIRRIKINNFIYDITKWNSLIQKYVSSNGLQERSIEITELEAAS